MEVILSSMTDSICHVTEINNQLKITTFRVLITKNGDALIKDYNIVLVLEFFPNKDHD